MAPVGAMACASSYHPVGALGDGYSELQLAPDRWVVTYATGAYAQPDRVAKFLLRRGAEIAEANDARYFAVLSGSKGPVFCRQARTLEASPSRRSFSERRMPSVLPLTVCIVPMSSL